MKLIIHTANIMCSYQIECCHIYATMSIIPFLAFDDRCHQVVVQVGVQLNTYVHLAYPPDMCWDPTR